MSALPLHIVILAAGLGKRMYAKLPKVLHCLAGRPLLEWVLQAAYQLHPAGIHVVYGHGASQLQQTFQEAPIHWVYQETQQGTAHAVLQALPTLPKSARVLILYGDTPLIQPHTLSALLALGAQTPLSLTLLSTMPHDPTGYGRIIRNEHHQITEIVEQKDASPAQLAVKETYTGICVTDVTNLRRWLPAIHPHNAQQEYYLTDIIKLAAQEKRLVQACIADNAMETEGINTLLQLATLERYYQVKQAHRLLEQGVKVCDPHRIDIRGTLHAQAEVSIDINTVFEGTVILEEGCIISPNCILKDVTIGAHTHVLPNSVIEQAQIGAHCVIGPFARIRPATRLADHCKIGNFVETKNAQIMSHSMANHLSYLGDVKIGQAVNIGAGTITCNYDGANKHETLIEDEAFIGSGTQLIAPVRVGKHATIGAGSTIRDDAPAHALTLSEHHNKTLAGWQRPSKKK